MSAETACVRLAAFAAAAEPPAEARARARTAFLDTVGVTLAGAAEPVARATQRVAAAEGPGGCHIFGVTQTATASAAALANGTAAHALDYDDMCFVSLAHPSAPLASAAFAAAEQAGASGTALLAAYVVGFEVEACLGRALNPRHYQRGWHCTSTLGVLGAAMAVGRLLGLGPDRMTHALAIAASSASGLKENFGTMVKPIHAGLAARNGLLAARLAEAGVTGSPRALDGPQGLLHAMDGERAIAEAELAQLGRRWEILDTGITVKLYPSCAGTHPTLDAVLDLRRVHGFRAEDVSAVEIGVDAITPTVLVHPAPTTDLEAKFSMPFCVAAAIAEGEVTLATFDARHLEDPALRRLAARVTMRRDASLDAQAPPLTEATVRIVLADGRVLTQAAHGARGYPEQPASRDELAAKFLSCAAATLPGPDAARLLAALETLETVTDLRQLPTGGRA